MNGTLQETIEHWFAQGAAAIGNAEAEKAFFELRGLLEAGQLRAAEPDASLAAGVAGECVGETWDFAGVSHRHDDGDGWRDAAVYR